MKQIISLVLPHEEQPTVIASADSIDNALKIIGELVFTINEITTLLFWASKEEVEPKVYTIIFENVVKNYGKDFAIAFDTVFKCVNGNYNLTETLFKIDSVPNFDKPINQFSKERTSFSELFHPKE